MNRNSPTLFSVLMMLGLGFLFSPSTIAQDKISVQLKSGRTFTGLVDSRTDDDRLWLRYGSERTTIIRPIRWDRVVEATRDGNVIPADSLRQLAETIQVAEPPRVFFQGNSNTTNNSNSATMAQRAKSVLGSTAPVRSISANAELANWDADVETDGLVLYIVPRTADGKLAEVSGTIEASLTAARFEQPRRSAQSRSFVTGNLGRWSKSITSATYRNDGIRIELPFQSIHPETATSVSPVGLLHVKFVIPGHGVFERSIDGVRIRPYTPIRDAQRNN